MSPKDPIEGIAARRRAALELGGKDAVARHHERGRLTVRERIDGLVDAGSFREYGQLAGRGETDADGELKSFTPTNVVMGVGAIDGRPVVVGGDDFTLKGGAYSQAGLKKGQYADQLAIQRRLPLVRLLEGGGASISGSYQERGRSGYDLTSPPVLNLLALEALATVPVVCAALGPCAGFPAGRLAASHLSIMTRETAVVLTGGPALVERALGAKLSKEELGGAAVHARSGVVDNVAEDEADALRQVRRFLSYLPPNVWETPPVAACDDPADRCEESLASLVPANRRRAYKVRRIVEQVVDLGSFFEMGRETGRSQVTGLARVMGQPVGVLASDGMIGGGCMSADGARKVRRFVELCDAFHLPIVSFVDEPGFAIGPEAERAATIRFGMEALFAVNQTTVPWFAFVLRKSFGVAQGIHYGPGCTVVAWPTMEAGALPVESGVELAYGREIAAAADPAARRRELEDEMVAAQSVFPRAEDFGVHELIDPRRSRPVLAGWVSEIQHQLRANLGPKRYSVRP